MGNTADKQRKQRLLNSKYRWKVSEFIDNYGNINGQQAKKWINESIADNFRSQTHTKFSQTTYRNGKQELLAAYERAYKGSWRLTLIMFDDVTYLNGQQIITLKYKNNVPSLKNPGQRVDLFFQCTACFDQSTGLWLNSKHQQYIPQSQIPKSQNYPQQTNTTSYPTSDKNQSDQRQQQMRRANRVRQQQKQRAQRQQRYRQQQRQFRQNMRRQEQQQRQYRRQQQLQAEQRQREMQQAMRKRY